MTFINMTTLLMCIMRGTRHTDVWKLWGGRVCYLSNRNGALSDCVDLLVGAMNAWMCWGGARGRKPPPLVLYNGCAALVSPITHFLIVLCVLGSPTANE